MTWQWTLLRAGGFRLDGGGMFGVVPKSMWSRLIDVDDDNRIGLQTNCLLLDDGTTRVLIETGYAYSADGKRDPFRSFTWNRPDRLARAEAAGPLEQFDLTQLEVVAVVWRTGNARALVQDIDGHAGVQKSQLPEFLD